jgi:two-component system chemotaxis sensor kinase CheA
VLLVEADAFSRRMLAPLLAAAGYDVTVAGGLHEARDAAQMGANTMCSSAIRLRLRVWQEEGFTPMCRGWAWVSTPTATPSGWLCRHHAGGDRGGLIAALDKQRAARPKGEQADVCRR